MISIHDGRCLPGFALGIVEHTGVCGNVQSLYLPKSISALETIHLSFLSEVLRAHALDHLQVLSLQASSITKDGLLSIFKRLTGRCCPQLKELHLPEDARIANDRNLYGAFSNRITVREALGCQGLTHIYGGSLLADVIPEMTNEIYEAWSCLLKSLEV